MRSRNFLNKRKDDLRKYRTQNYIWLYLKHILGVSVHKSPGPCEMPCAFPSPRKTHLASYSGEKKVVSWFPPRTLIESIYDLDAFFKPMETHISTEPGPTNWPDSEKICPSATQYEQLYAFYRVPKTHLNLLGCLVAQNRQPPIKNTVKRLNSCNCLAKCVYSAVLNAFEWEGVNNKVQHQPAASVPPSLVKSQGSHMRSCGACKRIWSTLYICFLCFKGQITYDKTSR